MTIDALTPTQPNKINRFERFHHYRKENPSLYWRFETAVRIILNRTDLPYTVNTRVLRDLIDRDFPYVTYVMPDGTDVFKAMLAWFRYKNPGFNSRFRYRKTERGRAKSSGINWSTLSKQKVPFGTLVTLADTLLKQRKVTTMTLLKRDAGVTFNQNFNAAIAEELRLYWPETTKYLPVRRRRVVR